MGGIGLGLVWGWLAGSVKPDRYRGVSLYKLGAATALIAIEVVVMTGTRSGLFFLGATILAGWLHIAWMGELKDRFGSVGQG